MTSKKRRVFISYSHDSESHKIWVEQLAKFLTENKIDVLLDKWHLDFGDDLPSFMEKGIRETDRVLVICTDNYIEKANKGSGGVGYEKTIITAEILKNQKDRRKFIPIVRNVVGENRLPTFFGAAYYLDLSDGKDGNELRLELLTSLKKVAAFKPAVGAIPFLPASTPEAGDAFPERYPSESPERVIAFSNRFSRAFPGVRGARWFNEPDIIAQRLDILLRQPLVFTEGHLAGWWRGPRNLHIDHFEHVEGSHFLMGVDELNIQRIAAVNLGIDYRKFVYVETTADEPTGLYSNNSDQIADCVKELGYADEEYALVDSKLPISRAEYDDGAALIGGRPIDIQGRAKLRARYITPRND